MNDYYGQRKAGSRTAAFCKIVKSKLISIIFTTALFILAESGFAQGFKNLNFESPILPLSPNFGSVSATNAIPNWTAYLDGRPIGSIGYDTVSLGGADVLLEDTTTPYGPHPLPIQGNYSVFLQGPQPGLQTSAAIGQTGTVPITAQSLVFFAYQGGLQVTFNGQALSLVAVSNALNYTIYGASILPFAGQTGELLFTTPVFSSALLDNIQFSSVPIPEPNGLALAALGALFLGICRRKR
jgi:hypothetical protein